MVAQRPQSFGPPSRSGSRRGSFSLGVQIDNPFPQAPPGALSPRGNPVLLDVSDFSTAGDKLVIIMVGLPARGKTHMARKVLRYLGFFHGVKCRIFNVAEYRRKLHGAYHSAAWFDPEYAEGVAKRQVSQDAALEDLVEWMCSGNDGRVGILDGTHSTLAKRETVIQRLSPLECKVRVFACRTL